VLKETVPKLSKVAILWNPDNVASAISFREGEVPAAKALGVALVSVEVRGPGDVERALTTIASESGLMRSGCISSRFRSEHVSWSSLPRTGSRRLRSLRSGRSLAAS
jgi:hypothetical protein